jgi:hypothetical protein
LAQWKKRRLKSLDNIHRDQERQQDEFNKKNKPFSKRQNNPLQISHGDLAIDVKLEEETVWLTLNQMSKLFDRDKSVISRHISNVFTENELDEISNVAKFATVQKEGNRKIFREIEYYNLDIIISVGYRVKSKRGTQFRIWVNKVLKDFLVKGYALNERRLKEQTARLHELEKLIDNFSAVAEKYQLEKDVFSGILKVVVNLINKNN